MFPWDNTRIYIFFGHADVANAFAGQNIDAQVGQSEIWFSCCNFSVIAQSLHLYSCPLITFK